ncbi:hypothetical protein JOS77_22060 [Chromobacterium haemolyticum]|nr:hypothetical protein JOS77_22060 [Chromobacterium haemolyticum]
MARRRKRQEEEHENHERWLVSYADFITLLFAFFVVMYARSPRSTRANTACSPPPSWTPSVQAPPSASTPPRPAAGPTP